MRRFSSVVATLLAAAVLAASCASAGSSVDDSGATPVAPVTAPPSNEAMFDATVDVHKLPGCGNPEKVRCWLPTQFRPQLVEKQTVSLWNKWPLHGDKVRVYCQTEGAPYTNTDVQIVTKWYGIIVPDSKVEPATRNQAVVIGKTSKAYIIGFVGSSWLSGGENKIAPTCGSRLVE